MTLAVRGPDEFEESPGDAEAELLNMLANNLDDGVSALNLPDIDRDALSRLVGLGAMGEDLYELGALTYKLLPVGIRINSRLHIEQSPFDVNSTTPVELSDKVGTVGKLGMLGIVLVVRSSVVLKKGREVLERRGNK